MVQNFKKDSQCSDLFKHWLFLECIRLSLRLWLQIPFFKKGGGEELTQADLQTLAEFMDNPQFY